MRKIICFLAVSFLTVCSANVLAETEQSNEPSGIVQVNVIIFKHLTPEGLNSEQFPHEFLQPDLKNAIELTSNTPATNDQPNLTENNQQNQPVINKYSNTSYVLLPAEKFGLQKELDALSKQSDHTILYYGSWEQPITASANALPIHITGGQTYDNNTGELNGKIAISKDQFFNANLDLYLTLPDLQKSGTLQTFRLNETRRLLVKQVHYFDHPLYGVILMLTTYS